MMDDRKALQTFSRRYQNLSMKQKERPFLHRGKIIYKEGSDPTLLESYRPISLLNVDDKIFATVMAERLRKCIPYVIHSDQTGFVTKRYMKDNIQNIEYTVECVNKKRNNIFISGCKKVFDNLTQPFLLNLLQNVPRL